jgi:hypothetical protein
MFAVEFGTGQVFLSMLYFFLFIIWFWLLISVFTDIFRSHDLSGWAKAAWSLFIIVLPMLGVLVYMIARGHKMTEHAVDEAQRQDEMFRRYVKDVAGTPTSEVDELTKLASLHDKGVIDDDEYRRMKARLLAA